MERERFFSRLATIPGLRTMPSIGTWILCEVENPADLARKVNRRIAPGTVSVPRHIPGAVRVPVRDPKRNEELFQTMRDIQQKKARTRYFQELKTSAVS
jgi:histidinol-phosphate/aromatic aminotransferase/cobyric acid decarboxylase-like protein